MTFQLVTEGKAVTYLKNKCGVISRGPLIFQLVMGLMIAMITQLSFRLFHKALPSLTKSICGNKLCHSQVILKSGG